MSKESLEHLSSLMDGELSRETGLFMARRLSTDEELCGTWKRYHMIRDCTRQHSGRVAFTDLTAGIRDALEEEAAEQAQGWQAPRWLKPVGGLAIAASVALVAINAIGPGPVTMNQAPEVAGAATQSFTSPDRLPVIPVSQPANYNPSNARLNSYPLRHNQQARAVGSQTFLAFVPIISTQAQAPEEGPAEQPQGEEQAQPGDTVEENRGSTPEQPPEQP